MVIDQLYYFGLHKLNFCLFICLFCFRLKAELLQQRPIYIFFSLVVYCCTALRNLSLDLRFINTHYKDFQTAHYADHLWESQADQASGGVVVQ